MPAAIVLVYIAAPLGEARVAKMVAEELTQSGVHVCSTWHATATGSVDPAAWGERVAVLAANLRDLEKADLVLALTAQGRPRATLSEIGYALALGREIVWLQGEAGEGGNIFDACESVTIAHTLDEAIAYVLDRAGHSPESIASNVVQLRAEIRRSK